MRPAWAVIMDASDRFDYDEHGDLDDIVVMDVSMFRMERMSDGTFWIKCYRDDKPGIVFWLNSTKRIAGFHAVED